MHSENAQKKIAEFFIMKFDVKELKKLHCSFRPSNLAIGKKDLALCLAGTYFAAQSAFHLNVKGEKCFRQT